MDFRQRLFRYHNDNLKVEGGETSLAFSKDEKQKMVAEYGQWIQASQAIFLMTYNKMGMPQIDGLRGKVRETGSAIHVVKNTLFSMALEQAGLKPEGLLDGTSLVGFGTGDIAGLAKVFTEAAKNNEVFVVKGGYLGTELLAANDIKALADLPPLPVVRAQLLGVFNAPATKLVRTLAEPARSLAAVVKANMEKGSASVAA